MTNPGTGTGPGAGFAIVVAEVRSISRRNAGAAGEIRILTGDSTGRIEAGTWYVS